MFASAETAGAATLTVMTLNDSGPGSLRDTIANASAGDTIQIQATGTITLTSGELLISQNLTITGPSASKLAISGNHASRVFEINAGATVAISGLTIENGAAPSTGNTSGGGILNGGTLTIMNSTVTGNSTTQDFASGGGVSNYGTLTIGNSSIAGNSASYGGGVFNHGPLAIRNSTVASNSASVVGGGFESSDAPVSITNSTVIGNSAVNEGGGIHLLDGALTITTSTVSGNSALSGAGLSGEGRITGAIKGTLLANNSGGNCGYYLDPGVNLSQGYNISDDNSCAAILTAAGDENNVVPGAGLDPNGLQGNGGPTQTIALLPTSPAVDHVPVANCTDAAGQPITTDQRGIVRPQGAACDTGAYELVQTVPFASFSAHLAIGTGKPAGFVLTSTLTLGSGSAGLTPASEAMTLEVGSYTLNLPAGSFHPLWNSANSPYIYTGMMNGANVALSVIPLGNNKFQFDAAASPVTFSGVQNPVTVSLTFGQDSGSASVQAIIR